MAIQNISVRPMYVYLGEDVAQVQTITCVADVAASLQNKYFLFHDAAGAKHYAWFNVATLGVDPAPAGGWTGHEVAIASGATASAVATALTAVLTAVTGFDATVSGYTVTLTHTATGYAQPAIDSTAAPTNFAFSVVTLGQIEKEYTCLKGDIEMSGYALQKYEVTCHSSGTTVQKEIITGYDKPQLSLVFQETDKASLQEIMVMYGMPVFTPVGADKDSVFGFGPANVGGTNPKVKIRLHEAALDLSNKSSDIVIWNAELGLDTFNFSGETASEIPATFSIYPDTTKPKAIQFYMIGDAAKAGY